MIIDPGYWIAPTRQIDNALLNRLIIGIRNNEEHSTILGVLPAVSIEGSPLGRQPFLPNPLLGVGHSSRRILQTQVAIGHSEPV